MIYPMAIEFPPEFILAFFGIIILVLMAKFAAKTNLFIRPKNPTLDDVMSEIRDILNELDTSTTIRLKTLNIKTDLIQIIRPFLPRFREAFSALSNREDATDQQTRFMESLIGWRDALKGIKSDATHLAAMQFGTLPHAEASEALSQRCLTLCLNAREDLNNITRPTTNTVRQTS